MSDESPPKKVGSLRDRIAAFEKQSTTQSPAAPVPRPKPSGIPWKPKQLSPPSSPASKDLSKESKGADHDTNVGSGSRAGGMSAADAKESIGQGGSLKERMAALQGKGAFGAGSPPTPPPKPASDKPKWKPPPRVASPSPTIEKDQPNPRHMDPQDSEGTETVESINAVVDQDDEPKEVDHEEEERQRRAAIAARLQRLGGSKIGMPPPVLGPKPAFRKPSLPKEESAHDSPDSQAQSPPAPVKEGEERKSSLDSAVLSSPNLETGPETSPSPPSGTKSPSLMPVPPVPRRAVPPRRKPGKPIPSAAPAAVEPGEVIAAEPPAVSTGQLETKPQATSSIGGTVVEREEEVEANASFLESAPAIKEEEHSDVDLDSLPTKHSPELEAKSLEDEPTPVPPSPKLRQPDSLVQDLPSPTELQAAVDDQRRERTLPDVSVSREESLPTFHRETNELEAIAVAEKEIEKLTGIEQPEEALKPDSDDSPPIETRVGALEVGSEEDEEIRRANIAELAKSSGVDPFAAGAAPTSPPVRKSSTSSTASRKNAVEPSSRKSSIDIVAPARKVSVNVTTVSEQIAKEKSPEVEDTDNQVQEENEQETSVYEDASSRDQDPDELVAEKLLGSAGSRVSIPPPKVITAISASISPTTQEDTEDDLTRTPLPKRRLSAELGDEAENKQDTSPPLPPPRAPSRPIAHETVYVEQTAPPLPPGRRTSLPPPLPPAYSRPPVVVAEESEERHTPRPSYRHISVPPPQPLHSATDASLPEEPSSDSSLGEEEYESFEIPVDRSTAGIHDGFTYIEPEFEVLNDSDGDPIDPSFISSSAPPPLPLNESSPPTPQPNTQPAVTQEEEVEETDRRRRLADRMAKLGGFRFGAPPPANRHPPTVPHEEGSIGEAQDSSGTVAEDPENEEDEQARRQRITAKLAGMGGMRFGMLPPGVPGGPPPPPANPPAPAPPTLDVESVSEDDGIRIEAEESEMEEVDYQDAEEDAPPTVPSRQPRSAVPRSESVRIPRLSSSGSRPRVPSPATFIPRKSSVKRSSTDSSSSHHTFPRIAPLPSEYVMVGEPEGSEDEPTPPPPPRPARSPLSPRNAPPPPPPGVVDTPDSLASSQWELPSIPSTSLELGGTGELLWSDDSTSYPSITNTAQPSSPDSSSHKRTGSARQGGAALSVEQLNLIWGRVGIQICEVAAELYERSKKVVVGDGTYMGFLNAVLSRVPNASQFQPDSTSFGYLIYAQTGVTVQKRITDIMPGDILVVHDAKLKGHKKLQTYHQNVGEGEPLLGIVGEFEAKKSKVRVYQASHHVGHQTVESVSYRLEDMKSGTIEAFRVMES